MFTCVLGRHVASTDLLVPTGKHFEGADSVGKQLRGEKECPLSSVTCRVWRKAEVQWGKEREGGGALSRNVGVGA